MKNNLVNYVIARSKNNVGEAAKLSEATAVQKLSHACHLSLPVALTAPTRISALAYLRLVCNGDQIRVPVPATEWF
jgi:hypothetical protein